MASITRTKSETVATVAAANKQISITVNKFLTVAESKELRKLLKAEEAKAEKQSETGVYTHTFNAGGTYGGTWRSI